MFSKLIALIIAILSIPFVLMYGVVEEIIKLRR